MNFAASQRCDAGLRLRPLGERSMPGPTAPKQPCTSTVWGLDAAQLHDLYWASRGVCVVRRGGKRTIDAGAPAYLLLEPHELVLFDMPPTARKLRRAPRRAMRITVRQSMPNEAPERFETDDSGRITAIRRRYDRAASHRTRVVITADAHIARKWRDAADDHAGRRAVRLAVGVHGMQECATDGWSIVEAVGDSAAAAMGVLMQHWRRPEAVLGAVEQVRPGVWAHRSAGVAPTARLLAPLWIGAGRVISPHQVVIGPQILPDASGVETAEPAPTANALRAGRWRTHAARKLDTTPAFGAAPMREPRGRRVFDICFAGAALLVTAPIMAMIAAAIVLDDGRPVLFAHRRQTLGGEEFNCYKFRTMRRDAEALKEQLGQQNICDGPQFYIRNDPRETRVGHWLRRFHLDELPQFWNVLRGHMSVIGPRPSPEAENRYCPSWRRARLSVKSGVTGLWQVRRTRAEHADFQEWIRYDTEYVQRRSMWLDLWIMLRTVQQIVMRK